MNISVQRAPGLCLVLALVSAGAFGQDPEIAVEQLGDDRYRIGAIEIDKAAQKFTVPGKIIGLPAEAPVEFLAVAREGLKSYESLVELDTTAVEFNTACILIGLDEAKAVRPEYHFHPGEVTGDVVDIRLGWQSDGVGREIEIERLLRNTDNPADHVWVYTGSFFTPDGMYGATMSGTLIGFVHDPESIIQHQAGLGLGQYGAFTIDPEVMPPGGTPVTVSVFRVPE